MTTMGGGWRWPRPGDLPAWVVPAVVLAVQVMGSTGAQHNQTGPLPLVRLDVVGYLLLAAGPVALLARRRFAVPVLLVVAACTVAYHLHGYTEGPSFMAWVVAIVSAVVARYRRAAWGVVVGAHSVSLILAWLAPVPWIEPRRPTLTSVAGLAVWAFAVLAGAELIRIRAERGAEARRVREEHQRRLAGEERLRIARELHDVLAHNISMINVQAGVALHLMDTDPGPGREAATRSALSAIKAASKEALTEMRSVIGALRQQGEEAPTTPTAGLDRLEALAAQARAAGMRVSVERSGTPFDLPASADLAAFRIVQESLTNARRHARPPAAQPLTVRIRIAYCEDSVSVRIDDDGVSPAGAGDDAGGSGIPGMRERAVALGGEFHAGPRPGGGFRVEAGLPLRGDGGGA